MKELHGYVCIATIVETRAEILFGKNPDSAGRLWWSLHNPLDDWQLFDDQAEARLAHGQMCAQADRFQFTAVGGAQLAMQIAETDRELHEFDGQPNLIVIMNTEGGARPLGAMTELGTQGYPIPGGDLCMNGLTPFSRFEVAFDCLEEAVRQGQCTATLATFHLDRLTRL